MLNCCQETALLLPISLSCSVCVKKEKTIYLKFMMDRSALWEKQQNKTKKHRTICCGSSFFWAHKVRRACGPEASKPLKPLHHPKKWERVPKCCPLGHQLWPLIATSNCGEVFPERWEDTEAALHWFPPSFLKQELSLFRWQIILRKQQGSLRNKSTV